MGVSEVFENGSRKILIHHLGFLKDENVGRVGGCDRLELVSSGTDAVDVEGYESHVGGAFRNRAVCVKWRFLASSARRRWFSELKGSQKSPVTT